MATFPQGKTAFDTNAAPARDDCRARGPSGIRIAVIVGLSGAIGALVYDWPSNITATGIAQHGSARSMAAAGGGQYGTADLSSAAK
jgi:hypothetical protein